MCSIIFLSSSSKLPVQYLKSGSGHFLPTLFQIIIFLYFNIRCYIICVICSGVKLAISQELMYLKHVLDM